MSSILDNRYCPEAVACNSPYKSAILDRTTKINDQRLLYNYQLFGGKDKTHVISAIAPNTTCVGTSLQNVARNLCDFIRPWSAQCVA